MTTVRGTNSSFQEGKEFLAQSDFFRNRGIRIWKLDICIVNGWAGQGIYNPMEASISKKSKCINMGEKPDVV